MSKGAVCLQAFRNSGNGEANKWTNSVLDPIKANIITTIMISSATKTTTTNHIVMIRITIKFKWKSNQNHVKSFVPRDIQEKKKEVPTTYKLCFLEEIVIFVICFFLLLKKKTFHLNYLFSFSVMRPLICGDCFFFSLLFITLPKYICICWKLF